MTSDDQQFLDVLASVPHSMIQYGSHIADYVEKHTNAIASDIRDALDSATWLPESLRPPRQQVHHFFAHTPPPPPQGIVERTAAWISRKRTLIAIAFAFAGTTYVLIHRRKKAHARKRRVKKNANGEKKEIVVLACSSFHDPMTRSLAIDLERRGYIVYVTVSSTEEDSLIQSEAKPDLRPLWMDLTSTVPNPSTDTHPNLEPIKELISRPSRPSSPGTSYAYPQRANAMPYSLAGLIILPGISGYPFGPLLTLPPTELIDTVNTRLISPILTIQQFLPLLASASAEPKAPASIVVAYSSIPRSLSPPFRVPEIVTSNSLSALIPSLRRDIKSAQWNISVTEMRLGNFDVTPTYNRILNSGSTPRGAESQALSAISPQSHWHSSQRVAQNRSLHGQSNVARGSSMREFHNAVFDTLAPPQKFKAFGAFEWQTGRRTHLMYVGSGARFYDWVGALAPNGLVEWMVGTKQGRPLDRTSSGIRAEREKQTRTPTWGSGSANSESGVWEKV